LASAFIALPNRRQFPDYYELIKHPMSLALIQERLGKTGKATSEHTPASGTGNGLKLKLKLPGANVGTGSTTVTMGQGVVPVDDKYEGYRDLEDVRRDFDLIWGNAKRCKSLTSF
jgi:hypothetical protein